MQRRFFAILGCAACLACAPPPDPATPVTPAPPGATSGDDRESESLLPPPPTATLRAPADDRREEVSPETGLPPAQAQ
jgi:hypothetical protein